MLPFLTEIKLCCYSLQFVLNAPVFYYLKTLENRKFFWCFQGVEKGCTGNEWIKSQKVWANTIQNHLVEKNCYLEQIVDRSDMIIKFYFLNDGRRFYCSSSMISSKAPNSYCKKNCKIICRIVSRFISSKSVSQIFEILFQIVDINTFVLRGVIYVLHFT